MLVIKVIVVGYIALYVFGVRYGSSIAKRLGWIDR